MTENIKFEVPLACCGYGIMAATSPETNRLMNSPPVPEVSSAVKSKGTNQRKDAGWCLLVLIKEGKICHQKKSLQWDL